MDCEQVQDEILEVFTAPRSAGDTRAYVRDAVRVHLAGCAACATFAKKQQARDRGLAQVFVAPRLSPHVRAAIRERARHGRRQYWSDLLPDAVHFASCAVVTLIALIVLPVSASTVLGVGALSTVLTHAVLTAFHESLDAADDLAL